jgi:hypothetical protein
MNIKGKLIEKFEVQNVSEKFKKREFVLEYVENNPQYPEFIKFELTQDRVNIVDPFQVGDMIDVAFNLRGRSWVNQQGVKNYFNSLQAWRITPAGSEMTTNQQAAPAQSYNQQQASYSAPALSPAQQDDDLPF